MGHFTETKDTLGWIEYLMGDKVLQGEVVKFCFS